MLLLDDDDELPESPEPGEVALAARVGRNRLQAIDAALKNRPSACENRVRIRTAFSELVGHARPTWLKVARSCTKPWTQEASPAPRSCYPAGISECNVFGLEHGMFLPTLVGSGRRRAPARALGPDGIGCECSKIGRLDARPHPRVALSALMQRSLNAIASW